MGIYLGNLDIEEIEKRTNVTFPTELKKFMSENHQSNAQNIKSGEWHCFDIPFVLLCGDMETAKKIHEYLLPLSSEFATPLHIAIQ